MADFGGAFNALGARPRSRGQYIDELQGQDDNTIKLQNALQGQKDQASLRQAAMGFGSDTAANTSAILKTGNLPAATAYQKSVLDAQKTQSDIGLNTSKAGEQDALAASHKLTDTIKKHDFAIQQLAPANSVPEALQWAAKQHANGTFSDEEYTQGVKSLMAAPDYGQWKQATLQSGVSAVENMKMQQAKVIADQTNATSISNNATTNRTHIAGIGMQQAGENQRHGETMANQRLVAGLNTDGTPAADADATVKAIGEGRMKPPTLQALRNPRIAAMMDKVNAQYPEFDATMYDKRQKAVKDFGTGKDGQSVQSANTALNHLDSLRELAVAQKNGDVRIINEVKNRIAKEFGGVPPANLQAAVTMVGPEISKAVIGAGGGQGDREKVDAALAALVKGGPAQAEGTLATMEDLFGGRLTEAKRTYERTTNLKDFESSLLSPAAQKILARKSASAPGLPQGWKIEKQ